MTRRSDTLLAFLLGAVAGGITAILLAPDKGTETRRKLRGAAGSAYRRGEELVDNAKRTVDDKAHEYSGAAKSKMADVSESARTHLSAVKEAVAEGRDAYRREINKS